MTRFLRGPAGGLLALMVIAALVFGGLGHATFAALELEEKQQILALQAEQAEKNAGDH